MTDRQREGFSELIRLGPQQNLPAALGIIRHVELAVGPAGAEKMMLDVPKSQSFRAASRVLRNFPLDSDRVRHVSEALSTQRGQLAFQDSQILYYGISDSSGKLTTPPTINQKELVNRIFAALAPDEIDQLDPAYSNFAADLLAEVKIGMAVTAVQNPESTVEQLQVTMLDEVVGRMSGKYWVMEVPGGGRQIVPDIFPGAPARKEVTHDIKVPGTDVSFFHSYKELPHELQTAVHEYAENRGSLVPPGMAGDIRSKRFGLRMQRPIEQVYGDRRPPLLPVIGAPGALGAIPWLPSESETVPSRALGEFRALATSTSRRLMRSRAPSSLTTVNTFRGSLFKPMGSR